jgi:uncharacterized phage protein (TIGR01671 family)
MSREIKFRAWHKKTERFQSGFHLTSDGKINFACLVDNEDYILSQFTGLKDKNGKEIFENDIIVLSHPCWSVKCIVKYDNQLACYVLESFEKIDKGVRKSFLHIYQEDLNYKVIGNIYQNPELLGGENE